LKYRTCTIDWTTETLGYTNAKRASSVLVIFFVR